jgi:hypothetical protein
MKPYHNLWKCLLAGITTCLSFFIALDTYAGTPHSVAGSVTYSGGGFPSSLTYTAYIESRPGEVLTQSSAGCAYYPDYAQFLIQCGSFSTAWKAGDVFHIDINDGAGGLASGEVILTYDPYDELNITLIQLPDISISSDPAVFGNLNVGLSLEITITISNTGTGTLNITSTSITGTGADSYSIQSGGSAAAVSAGGRRDLVVRFSPSTAGVLTATLVIASDDPDENLYNISLTGSGVCTLPSAPTAETILQPTRADETGSVVLSGLPSSGTWILTRSPDGITSAGTGAVTTISGLGAGTYNFMVTNASGCVSVASGNVFINNVPVITGQNIITVAEDHSLTITATHLMISDSDNTPAQMTISIDNGTNYTVSGENTITPAGNFNGPLNLPVRVSDGLASSNSFNITIAVISVNDAPIITGQNPISILENSSLTITVSNLIIYDPDNSPAQMTLSIGNGSNYTTSGSTITPIAGFSGILAIPVTVNDGYSTGNTFNINVAVNPVNHKPVITHIPDQTITKDATFAVFNLDDFVEDFETPDGQLFWSYSGITGLVVSIVDRVVMITRPDENWTGSDTIIFMVTDDDPAFSASDADTVVYKVTEKAVTDLNDPAYMKIIAYPIPTDNYITIGFVNMEKREVSVEVISACGEMVMNATSRITDNTIVLNLHDLLPGNYVVRLITSDAEKSFHVIKR